MLKQRFSIFIFLFSFICLSSINISYAQYKGNSDFLYGKWKSTVPYYISLQGGVASSQTFFNKDFRNEGGEFSWGLAFEKPISYRSSLNVNFRSKGNYQQSFLGNNTNPSRMDSVNANVVSQVDKAYDLSINYSYMFLDHRSWQSRISAGIGYINSSINTEDSVTRNLSNTSAIIPIQLSTGRPIWGRWEIEFAYRYYIALNDELDGYTLNNKFDKYSYAYIGLKYMLGEKDYRFQKKGSCPSVK